MFRGVLAGTVEGEGGIRGWRWVGGRKKGGMGRKEKWGKCISGGGAGGWGFGIEGLIRLSSKGFWIELVGSKVIPF